MRVLELIIFFKTLFVTVTLRLPTQNKFGIIADVQYADIPNALNFQGTQLRRYRQSLQILSNAIVDWNAQQIRPSFSLMLGDIVDYKSKAANMSNRCLNEVLAVCNWTQSKLYFCFGNHCHSTFSRGELLKKLAPVDTNCASKCSARQLYYHWMPFPGWRFVSIDSYDVSLISPSSEQNRELAHRLLSLHNNEKVQQHRYDDLPNLKQRFVPYNGAVGERQLMWLQRVLQTAKENAERVVIFCHQPIHSPGRDKSLIWNCEDVLKVVWDAGNVCLWLAGHDHDGQYSVDSRGVHHLVPPAPIECGEGETAYGTISVHADRLSLDWKGRVPRLSEAPWPTDMFFAQ